LLSWYILHDAINAKFYKPEGSKHLMLVLLLSSTRSDMQRVEFSPLSSLPPDLLGPEDANTTRSPVLRDQSLIFR